MPVTIYWELWRYCPYFKGTRKHVWRERVREYVCEGCDTHVWTQSDEKWRPASPNKAYSLKS